MRRKLFNLAWITSLVLLVATVVLWIATASRGIEYSSYRAIDLRSPSGSVDAPTQDFALEKFDCGVYAGRLLMTKEYQFFSYPEQKNFHMERDDLLLPFHSDLFPELTISRHDEPGFISRWDRLGVKNADGWQLLLRREFPDAQVRFAGFNASLHRGYPLRPQDVVNSRHLLLRGYSNQYGLMLPVWMLLLLLSVMPALAATRLFKEDRARQRQRRNLCPVCAYDLRASTDRCPECGTPISPTPLPSDDFTT